MPLSRCQIAVYVNFDLIGELVLHVLLDSAQHERLQNHMKPTKLRFVHRSVLVAAAFDIFCEPFAEFVVRIE